MESVRPLFQSLVEATIIITILAIVAYWAANFFFKVRHARVQMDDAHPFTLPSDDHARTLLVIGDSTAAGVGASAPEDSVAGRLAAHLGATYVENYGTVGSGVEGLSSQIVQAKLPYYDAILVQAGADNLFGFHDVRWAGRVLGQALGELPKAGKVIVLSPGDAGGVTIFPPLIRPFHQWASRRYHKEFGRVAAAWGAIYVDLFEEPMRRLFFRYPDLYLSRDGLHPSSEGYRLWFECVERTLAR